VPHAHGYSVELMLRWLIYIYLQLQTGWYVPVGAISGLVSAFFLIGDEA